MLKRLFRDYAGLQGWETQLFFLTLLAAVGTIWIPERLPMVDLPQHVAQVAAWRAILEGHFAWADLVTVSYLKPYFLGYGLLLPLTYIMSVTAAPKLLLSISFASFVALCMILRRELGGAKHLDWLFLWGYFGFAWRWGLLTYLCAAPLVILFLIVALRQSRINNFRNSIFVLLVGIFLLFSHGLQFLFAVAIGGFFVLINGWSLHRKLKAYIPYCLLAALSAGLWLAMREVEDPVHIDNIFSDVALYKRAMLAFYHVAGNTYEDEYGLIFTIAAFLAPCLLLGCKLGSRKAWIPFAVYVAVFLFAPNTWMSAALLYERFALYFLPFWALALKAAPAGSLSPRRSQAGMATLAIATIAMIGMHAQRQFEFGRSSTSFETVLAAAEPNRRALSLIYEKGDDPAYPVYLHYPAWYQAEKGGFVDFNFASFKTSMVKFRSDRIPAISKFLGFVSPDLDLSATLPAYDYLFIRGTPEDVNRLMKNSGRCRFRLRAEDGLWRLLENEGCAALRQ